MKKPLSVRLLMVLAALVTGVTIGLEIYLVSNPDKAVGLVRWANADLMLAADFPVLSRSLLMMRAALAVPLTILCVINAITDSVRTFKGVLTIMLAEFFNILRLMGDNYLYNRALDVALDENDAVVMLTGAINSAIDLVAHLNYVAIIFICCAAAVEIYLADHPVYDDDDDEETAEE